MLAVCEMFSVASRLEQPASIRDIKTVGVYRRNRGAIRQVSIRENPIHVGAQHRGRDMRRRVSSASVANQS